MNAVTKTSHFVQSPGSAATEVARVEANLGAEVSGLDLTAPLTAEIADLLRSLLWEHQVLFFRDTGIDDAKQAELGRIFGEPEVDSIAKRRGVTPDQIIPFNTGPYAKGYYGTRWHADATYLERPYSVSILRSVIAPELGGDTAFSSGISAYESLPEEVKQRIDTLSAIHRPESKARSLIKDDGELQSYLSEYPGVEHPVVIRHPANGRKVLYVNETFTQEIVGFTDAEGERLLSYLTQQFYRPENTVRFKWRPGSLAIWDNRAVHWPLQAPDAEIAKYKGVYDDGPDVLRERRLERLKAQGLIPADVTAHPVETDAPEWLDLSEDERALSARSMEVYAAMVDRIDQNVGRVVDWLKRTGQYDDTVIVFLSDNGAEGAIVEAMPIIGPVFAARIRQHCDNSLANAGRPGSYIWYGPRWAQAATAPSRLVKAYTTEGGIRVPAFVRLPGDVRAGEVADAFSTAMDIAPTFLDLAGVPHPGTHYRGREIVQPRGRSLRPWLAGEAERVHPEGASTGWELFGRRAIRKDNWKAVYVPDLRGHSRWQLYDLDRDQGEVFDLAASRPGILAELLDLWEQYRLETGVVEGAISIFDAEPFAWTGAGSA